MRYAFWGAFGLSVPVYSVNTDVKDDFKALGGGRFKLKDARAWSLCEVRQNLTMRLEGLKGRLIPSNIGQPDAKVADIQK